MQVKTLKPDERRALIFEDATGTLDNVDIANENTQRNAPVLVDKADAITLRGSSRGIETDVHSN